jgi:hypothetical protein
MSISARRVMAIETSDAGDEDLQRIPPERLDVTDVTRIPCCG